MTRIRTHKLSNLDPVENTVTCATCGPGSRVTWKWNRDMTAKTPRCSVSIAEGRRRSYRRQGYARVRATL